MDVFEKQKKLMEIAQNDNSYLVWSKTCDDTAKQFEEYVNAQPEDIRNILWGYAAGGQMKNQRLVNLACEHMEFTGLKEK